MERHRRGKGKQRLLGSHQKCWIWGRNAVQETLAAGRWPILELHLADTLPDPQRSVALELAQRTGVAVTVAPGDALTRLCHSAEHQGYLARMTEFPYAAESEILSMVPACPALVILDGIQDPYNLGAIVRSAEVFGMSGVVMGIAGQVGVTSMVVRSSAGAVNRVPIARVDALDEFAGRIVEQGVRLVAATEKASRPLMEADLTGPVAVVIGNEGGGIRPALLGRCADQVSIPLSGRIGSLNAAVAASVFFYEVRRQRGLVRPGSG